MKFALIIYISSYCYRRMTEFKEQWLGLEACFCGCLSYCTCPYRTDLDLSGYFLNIFNHNVYCWFYEAANYFIYGFNGLCLHDYFGAMENAKNIKFCRSLECLWRGVSNFLKLLLLLVEVIYLELDLEKAYKNIIICPTLKQILYLQLSQKS